MDSITIDWAQPAPEHEPWRSPDVSVSGDAEEIGNNGEDGIKQEVAETLLMLRGGGDRSDASPWHNSRPTTGCLQDSRRGILSKLLKDANVERPLRVPGEIREGLVTTYTLDLFTHLETSEINRKTVIERWLDTAVLDETEKVVKAELLIFRRWTQPWTSSDYVYPPYEELQFTSAADGALELALAASEDSSSVIEVDEVNSESSTEQNGSREQVENLHGGTHETSATSHEPESDVQSVSYAPTSHDPSLTRESKVRTYPTPRANLPAHYFHQ